MAPVSAALVTARNEEARLAATLSSLGAAFPEAHVVLADDASTDATPRLGREAGAEVVRAPRRLGKGGAATLGARRLLATAAARAGIVVLCDGDLADSASELELLASAVERGEGDLAVAAFARRVGGGFGLVRDAARAIIRARTGLDLAAPISGQRAMRADVLRAVVPFAPGFGMETAMTIDAHRAGFRVVEVEVSLKHRATGRTLGGFGHRGRQLADVARVHRSRR